MIRLKFFFFILFVFWSQTPLASDTEVVSNNNGRLDEYGNRRLSVWEAIRRNELLYQAMEEEIDKAFVEPKLKQQIIEGNCAKNSVGQSSYPLIQKRYLASGTLDSSRHDVRDWNFDQLYRDMYRSNTVADKYGLSVDCYLELMDFALYETVEKIQRKDHEDKCLPKVDIRTVTRTQTRPPGCPGEIWTDILGIAKILQEQPGNMDVVKKTMEEEIKVVEAVSNKLTEGCVDCDSESEIKSLLSDPSSQEEAQFSSCCNLIQSKYPDKTTEDCHKMIDESNEKWPGATSCLKKIGSGLVTAFKQMDPRELLDADIVSGFSEIAHQMYQKPMSTLMLIGQAVLEFSTGYNSNLMNCLNTKHYWEQWCDIVGHTSGTVLTGAAIGLLIKGIALVLRTTSSLRSGALALKAMAKNSKIAQKLKLSARYRLATIKRKGQIDKLREAARVKLQERFPNAFDWWETQAAPYRELITKQNELLRKQAKLEGLNKRADIKHPIVQSEISRLKTEIADLQPQIAEAATEVKKHAKTVGKAGLVRLGNVARTISTTVTRPAGRAALLDAPTEVEKRPGLKEELFHNP